MKNVEVATKLIIMKSDLMDAIRSIDHHTTITANDYEANDIFTDEMEDIMDDLHKVAHQLASMQEAAMRGLYEKG